MKCIVLAAGYATRLHPLTLNTPKPLLKVAGMPMIEHILGKIAHLKDVDEIFVVTNDAFYPVFYEWSVNLTRAQGFSKKVRVVNDGTVSNETRLGAIGDVLFVINHSELDDDLLVIAGDNLFEFSLIDYMQVHHRTKAPVLAVYDVGSLEAAKKFGVVAVDAHNKLIEFVEKPVHPKSSLIATACYFFPKNSLKLIHKYVAEGNAADRPGDFIAWLHRHNDIYCYVCRDAWFDIGSHESLKEADEYFARRKTQ